LSKEIVVVANKRPDESINDRSNVNAESYIAPELIKQQNLKIITAAGEGSLDESFSYSQIETRSGRRHH
jgi:hypothetical protein